MNMLSGKTAVITGASRGIGRAVAGLFIANGACIVGTATKEGPFAAELATLAESKGVKAAFVYGDIGKADEAARIAEEALKLAASFKDSGSSGAVDVLVNNAGITKDGLFMRMSDADWDSVLDVNLSGAFFVTRRILRDMIGKRSGSVIFMSSVVGVHGNGGQANYSASKAGMIGLAKSLAIEVGSRNVRVNAIAPGYIATEMTEKLPEAAREAFLKKIPLGRPATAEEVAKAALFLASDLSTYITGTVLSVDGGLGT